MYALVLSLVVFALWHARAHRGLLSRWGGLILVVLVSFLAASFCPWAGFKLKPVDQLAADQVMSWSGFEIPPRAFNLQKESVPEESSQPQFNVNITPKTKSLPARHVVEWSAKDGKLLHAAGGEIPGYASAFHSELFHYQAWNNPYNPDDFVAWAAEFPEDVLFRQGNSYGGIASSSLGLGGKFKVPASRGELTETLTLQASLEARVFQWRKIAELPIKPGATATDEFGAWKFVATKQDPLPYPSFYYYLERRQISLSTAADSRCSRQFDGPLTRMVWMVYDPVRHVVWMPDSSAYRSAERGPQTALAHYFIVLNFYNRQKVFSAAELERCRLLVFEKTWLGSVPESWQSAAFTLDEKLLPVTVAGGGNNEPMPRLEFNRRVAALKMPAPDASRREVSLYLLEFLRLVDAQHFTLTTRDPMTLQLARFVPAHLDLLLDGLPVMGGSYATVINAIKVGATDAQKPVIIAALLKNPPLADVVLARDWVEEARPEIYQLLKLPHPLPLGAMRAIAWFHDPETYPRLLEEFESHPGVSEYEFLRTLPGLEKELDAIIARHWRAESLVLREPGWQMFNKSFRLAMHHGETSALQRVYQLLNDPNEKSPNNVIPMGYSLADMIQMPGLKPEDRHNHDLVLAWMRQHRPEDFVFSPARRQFVLKPTP